MCNIPTERMALRNPTSVCPREALLRLRKIGSCGIPYSLTYALAFQVGPFCILATCCQRSQQTWYVLSPLILIKIANIFRCQSRHMSVVLLDCTYSLLTRIECKPETAQEQPILTIIIAKNEVSNALQAWPSVWLA